MGYKRRVLHLNGTPVDWSNPPPPHVKVKWTKRDVNGRVIVGDFRSICHLDYLNRRAIRKFGVELQVIQQDYNTGVAASAGTHDYSSIYDVRIPGIGWMRAQRFLRADGFFCWVRKPPLFSWHIHGGTLPPLLKFINRSFAKIGLKVGKYIDGGWSLFGRIVASSQLVDYMNHAFGLAGQHTPGSDKSWFPKNIKKTVFDLEAYCARRANGK